jgi:hypothetical protein
MKILHARCDLACSWAVMEMLITAHAVYPRIEHNSIFIPINSTISIHPKRRYAYGGEHGTFNIWAWTFKIQAWNFKHVFVCRFVRHIFFMWINPLVFEGGTIQQNLVTRTTSTVFKILTWNFQHNIMFGMKCRCEWHIVHFIFRVDQSITFWRGHGLTKSCDANFYSFQDINLKLIRISQLFLEESNI